jgi:hypothetical protein
LLWVLLSVLVGLASLWIYWSIELEDCWSISIYTGSDPLSLRPDSDIGNRPVLTAKDVVDISAKFIADPFMVQSGERWYMFFEALESRSRRGVICLASSADRKSWQYDSVVLREPFHLSYPYVFESEGIYYMIPECAQASEVRLYRAAEFPRRWQLVHDLLRGIYFDPSIVFHEQLWWLFALDERGSLTLHFAASVEGPWTVHPRSPVIVGNINSARPGGRLITFDGKIIRYAQDGEPTYGSKLRAFQVDHLSTTSFREHEIPKGPVLAGSGRGWNAAGMHHADAHRLDDGCWIACVDGNKRRARFNWRAGVRRIVDSVM